MDFDSIDTSAAAGAGAAANNTNDGVAKIMNNNDDASNTNNDNSNASESEDEQYQTSYSKFTNNVTSNSISKQPRKRRGGYGNSSSILEGLPESNGSGDTTSYNTKYDNDDNVSPKDEFGLDMNDFISQELGSGTQNTDIFMNDSGGEDDGDGDDDDDATRPCDNEEMSDLEKIGPWTGDIESSDEEDKVVDEEAAAPRSRGRTKQTKKSSKNEEENEEEVSGAEDDENNVGEGELSQFSLGNPDRKEGIDTEKKEEKGDSMDVDKVEAPTPMPNSDELEPKSDGAPMEEEEQVEAASKKSMATSEDANPSESEVLSLVDTLFLAANKDTMTVGDINRSVASHFGWKKVDKKRKLLVRDRLTYLVSKEATPEGSDKKSSKKKSEKKQQQKKKKAETKEEENIENGEEFDDADLPIITSYITHRSHEGDYESEEGPVDDDDEEYAAGNDDEEYAAGNDSSSDYEEESPKKKKSLKTPKGKSIKKNKARTSSRSKSKSGKGKMAKHLRDHHSRARLRQMEEARIRKEELGHLADDNDDDVDMKKKGNKKEEDTGPKISKEDRQRAEEIQARFNTNSEELIAKRREHRMGVIDKLKTARLEMLEENLTLSEMALEVKEEVKVEGGQPKLTLTTTKKEDYCDTASDKMVDLGGGESSDEDGESDDDDLEIIAPTCASTIPKGGATIAKVNAKKKTSAADLLFSSNNNAAGRRNLNKTSKPKSVADLRNKLRNSLRSKKMKTGNKWLAHQLEYENEEEHIRDCIQLEEKKRRKYLLDERKTAEREKRAAERDEAIFGTMATEEPNDVEKEFVDEEDEEMAMARDQGLLEETDATAGGEQDGDDKDNQQANGGEDVEVEGNDASKTTDDDKSPETDPSTGNVKSEVETKLLADAESNLSMVVTPFKVDANTVPISDSVGDEETTELAADTASSDPFANDNEDGIATEETIPKSDEVNVDEGTTDVNESEKKIDTGVSGNIETSTSSDDKDNTPTSPVEEKQDDEPKSKKPKNSAWQAMLAKEKASLAKQKKLKRKNGGLVEGEAEEEEEEEGIIGLEDFGFAVNTKKDDDEDGDAEVDEDDLEHVVDELSDGEGDEEAGENARKRLQRQEEKQRHDEIIRRMRDGHDGRRGGIASGVGGARGMLRFDQLVAADNREDAKRLGLLNDDELNSDDENEDGEGKDKKKGDDDEEEDETALLDKMIKERFIRKDDELLEEDFSDDEESENEEDGTEQKSNEDNDEEREQNRLAKQFEKRARRNRVLDKEDPDSTMSKQATLLDEDKDTQTELRMIKTSFFRKRSMEGSNLGSNLCFKENNDSSERPKFTSASGDAKPKTNFFSQEGSSLSVALMASRGISRKRKATTFRGGKQTSTFSRSTSSSSSKSVALNHVVFLAGDDSKSATSQLSNLNSFTSRRSKPATSKSSGGSLWSKVVKSNFRAKN